jgi:hypothetical protein
MERGKLYRVTSYAYEKEAEVRTEVRRGGWLYIWEGEICDDVDEGEEDEHTFYICRSLATGDTQQFLAEELGAADGEG